MATCKECLHYDLCEALEMNGLSRVHPSQCGFYEPTADVVPVVRCKDCEYGQFMESCSMYLCHCTGGKLRYADNYCNYGERKAQE